MTVLKYATQVKSVDSFKDEVTDVVVSDAEYDLAGTLIEETTTSEFHLSEYTDEYTANLTQSRRPTLTERFRYEQGFLEEMQAKGDLWQWVASFVWEQA
jgi:non-homologous end joining protein Ku